MASRIGEYVQSGELRNTRRNGVFGWIEFATDYGIRIELTGNLSGPLAGKHLRFRRGTIAPNNPDDLTNEIKSMADRQIGVVGEMRLKMSQVPDLPWDEFSQLDHETQQRHLRQKECLHLEWFSQNGHIVAELVGMTIEYVESEGETEVDPTDFEPLDSGSYGLGFTEIHVDEDGSTHTAHFDLEDDGDEEEEEIEDPYGLFGNDLEQHVAESLGKLPDEPTSDETPLGEMLESEDGSKSERRAWDEVMPGIDADTKAMYEQWDEIFEGKKDEPISYLFQTPLKLPKVENVSSHDEARPLVTAILAQLALLSVALDVCEHYEPLDTYRLLMKEILPTAKVHPNLAASDMVQHYSTSDFCVKCDEEFDEEYDGSRSDPNANDEDDSNDGSR